jgi:hypothetical protein
MRGSDIWIVRTAFLAQFAVVLLPDEHTFG